MSAQAATRAPGWFKRGYEGPREFERARLYERGTSQKNHRRHDVDLDDYKPVKSRLMLDISAGFYEPVAPPAPRFARGYAVNGVLDGQRVTGEVVRIVRPPFGDTLYTFHFSDGQERTINESRLMDFEALLRTSVAAPPVEIVAQSADIAVSGAIILAPCRAIVPFGFWGNHA